jgi:AraC family transcriptional regulator of adaptative response/methylated-DNA-[protein]-cysteine methyltransferase
MFRINAAFKKLQKGETVTSAAFDSGYESVSGSTDSFKSIFGLSPKASKQTRIIDLTRIESPLGTMIACAVDEGICLLEFTDRRMLETEFKQLSKLLNATIVQGSNSHFVLLEKELHEYFEGKRKNFTVPLFTPGTAFQNAAWKELQNIPYATTRSYKQQAVSLHQPLAVRAVANANGMNRIALIIPCHRVIGDNGDLTGYGGGIWRKKWLLDHELKHQ